jgi:hypothetical protein
MLDCRVEERGWGGAEDDDDDLNLQVRRLSKGEKALQVKVWPPQGPDAPRVIASSLIIPT